MPREYMTIELGAMATVPVYADGSGKAGHTFEYNLKQLAKHAECVDLLCAFIANNIEKLVGLSWEPDVYDTAMRIECQWCKGERTDAKKVARLFPGLKWRRVEPEYGIDKATVRDWMAECDGIKIRIRRAEVYKPVVVKAPWSNSLPIQLGDE